MRDNFLEKFSSFMVRTAKFFVKVAVFFVVIYFVGMRLFNFGHDLFFERPMDKGEGTEVVVEITKDDNDITIADKLYEKGLIDDKLVFRFRAKIYKTKFTPNTYNLKTSMTIKNILDVFDSPTTDFIVKQTNEADDVYQLSPEEEETDAE